MASLPAHATQHLTRLTTAARLARVRPAMPVEVIAPGILTTERLTLRPMQWGDREAYIDAVRASRPELDRFCPLHTEGELDDELFDRQLQLTRAAEATGRAIRRIAEVRSQNGRIVGVFNLNDISYGLESRAEATFWVRTDASGSGYASEGLRALLEHAFAARWAQREEQTLRPAGLGLARVDSLVAPENEACLRLMRRVGFVADRGRGEQQLVLGGRQVAHAPFVCFAQVGEPVLPDPIVPRGVSLARSIASLLSIEQCAAAEN